MYYPFSQDDLENQSDVNHAHLNIKENFWRKFFYFRGRLDQLGFMVRICVLTLLLQEVNRLYNLAITPVIMGSSEISLDAFKLVTVLFLCGKTILGIAYISLSLRRLNDIGISIIFLLLPIIAILTDLSCDALLIFFKDFFQEIISDNLNSHNIKVIKPYIYLTCLNIILQKTIIFFFLFLCLKKGIYGSTKHGSDGLYQNCHNYLRV